MDLWTRADVKIEDPDPCLDQTEDPFPKFDDDGSLCLTPRFLFFLSRYGFVDIRCRCFLLQCNEVIRPTQASQMEEYLHLFVEEADFYNGIVLGNLLPGNLWNPLPHMLQSWLRNYIGGILLYFLSAALWSFYIYHWKRHLYFPPDSIPSNESMRLQIIVSMKALPWYGALPTIAEYMVERGWTRCFSSISEVGWPAYLVYVMLYLGLVEFGIYWAHRELHDIKPLYKHLHATHHMYNKQNTISPFAGMALHPLDGILQAAPHVIALFIVPTHFMTHMVLLFCDGVWTTNIHDCIHGKVWPIMGAGYHSIHHTTYRHNYGHYTVWMDWMFGTLCHPEVDSKKLA